MNQNNQAIEFYKIKEQLKEYALSTQAKEKAECLEPYLNQREVISHTKDTTEARRMLDTFGAPPLDTMKDIHPILELAELGSMLIPEQLEQIRQFAAASKRLKDYLKKSQILETDISSYSGSIDELEVLREEITMAVRNQRVDDNASPTLKGIRRKIEQINSDMKSKLETLLRNRREIFSDGYVSERNGHFVLPVKKEYKNQFPGSLIDTSSTGSTCFIEPSSIGKMQGEMSSLKIDEINEENKILYTLTSLVLDFEKEIRRNTEAMIQLDFIFAKGKLSANMDGISAKINTGRTISITEGRHPLLPKAGCVPLNLEIGKDYRGIIITGPNTGGKTVALKTAGILSAMAQSGLHIPCRAADICMNNMILCDIGDGQSITENLSTFSAHIKNILSILQKADEESLVLLDEVGSGTDPGEGMGIAIAILEALREKKCLFIATTHYPEVKEYAAEQDGLINARMAFDRESLNPLYQLEIGEAGESCALHIAKRLGMPKSMLEYAYQKAYGSSSVLQTNLPSDLDESFFANAAEDLSKIKIPGIQKDGPALEKGSGLPEFHIGDSVFVLPHKKIGIVCQETNSKGQVGVMVQKEKRLYNHTRIKLHVPAKELYPEDYDFSIIFDTVENRKARNKMNKRYAPEYVIHAEEELK